MSRSTVAQVTKVPHKESSLIQPADQKHAGFQSRGQAWFCSTELPSDVTVEVDEMVFHLHKFPLISRSGKLASRLAEAASEGEEEKEAEDGTDKGNTTCCIRLEGMPGGPGVFEQVAKFCYGMKVEFTAANVAALRCASEYLQMTEEYGEKNLVCLTERFLNHVVVKSWTDSVVALQSCEALLPLAESLSIVKKCVDSIVVKACTDPNFRGSGTGSLRSPDGTLLWNGISTGARPKHAKMDWWYEDISMLSLPMFKRVIVSMKEKGLRAEMIAGALMFYAKKLLPGLTRRRDGHVGKLGAASPTPDAPPEAEQVFLLETIESLLPSKIGVATPQFLFGLLKIATILHASAACKASLENRIAAQLEQATLEDILIPNFSYTSETLYDVNCVQRLMQLFAGSDKALLTSGMDVASASPFNNNDQRKLILASPSSVASPLRAVAKLLDAYLGEIAPDMNLKPAKFQALAACLPHHARALDDGLYRAIDIFIKGHLWMSEEQREMLCNVMDCQKLSLEACSHAAQNERLPMRVVVQVLFMEQMQLRAAIMECLNGTTPRNSAATPDVAATIGKHPTFTYERQGTLRARQLLAAHQNLHMPDILVDGRLSAAPPHQADTSVVAVNSELVATPMINSHGAQVRGGGRRRRSGAPPQLNQHGSLTTLEQSQALRIDLLGLRSRIGELERECSRLRGRLHRKASGWAFLSAKLTCRSISDISDMSGALQRAQSRSRPHAITAQPSPHAARARPSSSSTCHHRRTSSSSSTHSLYTPSPKFS